MSEGELTGPGARRERRGDLVLPAAGALDPSILAGIAVMVASFIVFFWSAGFDAARPDLFYLSYAFDHGRTWLSVQLGPWDVIPVQVDGAMRYYVPFGPFPAIFFMPLMLFVSPETAHKWESIINPLLAAVDVGLVWMLAGRIGVRQLSHRLWLCILLGFSTAIWWVEIRGGVWHTGHLIATMMTLLALSELFGSRRAWLIGLLAGAAFLSRAPVAFAIPLYAIAFVVGRSIWKAEDRRAIARDWVLLGIGVAPSILFYFWYNWARFGSPLESGYALAALPDWLQNLRNQGLFSLSHWAMNWDFFMLKVPHRIPGFPWFQPDGLGMSILITSPGLLLAFFADWRKPISWVLAGAFVLVMLPNLLYYGGGWLQYGFRYALDAIPFAVALCAVAIAKGRFHLGWWLVLAFGVVVNLMGVYWAYNLQ